MLYNFSFRTRTAPPAFLPSLPFFSLLVWLAIVIRYVVYNVNFNAIYV